MKSIKLLLIGLAAAFALTGCGDSSKDTPEPEGDGNVVGSWHLVSWSSLQSADVYLSFSESGSFDIYQRLYKPEYVHLDGTYSYDKPTLSGRYSDNTPWGSASYRVSFNADGTRMTLTSTSSTSDVSVFVKPKSRRRSAPARWSPHPKAGPKICRGSSEPPSCRHAPQPFTGLRRFVSGRRPRRARDSSAPRHATCRSNKKAGSSAGKIFFVNLCQNKTKKVYGNYRNTSRHPLRRGQ